MTARSICSVRGDPAQTGGTCGAGEGSRGGGGGRGAGYLDRHAEKSVAANPSLETDPLVLDWLRCPSPAPPLTLGLAEGGSRELIGHRVALCCDRLSLSVLGLAAAPWAVMPSAAPTGHSRERAGEACDTIGNYHENAAISEL